jgi:enediyne biosynthesis protein E4
VEASEWTWSAIFLDVDLDGYEDLLIANGNHHDVLDADSLRETSQPGKSVEQHVKDIQKFPRLELANLAFRNRGDLTFEEVGAKWGFGTRGISHGMALADLDNDGDLDVVINNLNSVAGIYRNDSAAARVAVRLKGNAPNTRGIGAKIKVTGGPIAQSQEMISGGRYLSCDDAMRVFAAGTATNDLRIEVTWRSGARSVVEPAKPNSIYEIDESSAVHTPIAVEAAPLQWFSDASGLLKHAHHEEPFDDFQRQPLLPNQLSRVGPGVSWFDVNADGWEDLIVGSGKGGTLAIFQNDTKGGFVRLESPALSEPAMRDQTGIVAWKNNGSATVLMGSANYEDGFTNVGACVRQFSLGANKTEDVIGVYRASVGPLALADFDGDGDLDLILGGRVVAGRWPETADSRIYKFASGKFELDAANSRALEKVGMVSGAVWADMDGDGWSDLILACQWGPVRVFKNERGALRDVTSAVGLDRFAGWWSGVNVGDFDADGKLDIVASNWGLNSGYRATTERPARLFFGDVLERNSVDIIEAEYDGDAARIVPTRPIDVLGAVIPTLREQFTTHRAFSQATVAEAFGPYKSRLREMQATTLASTIFFNRGGKFEAVALPSEAQWAPAFAVNVADFDGDGADDIFLSQNFFDTHLELSRCDAGRGLLLRNVGGGKMKAVSGQESGVEVYGEQRGAAICDYNHDGRVDLVVTQNSGETKLYTNTRAKPGLRVTLRGPAGNPDGIGAQVRVRYRGGRLGPVRNIAAGSGYWSQDSSTQIFAVAHAPEAVVVRWPGGKEQVAPVATNTKELVVEFKP